MIKHTAICDRCGKEIEIKWELDSGEAAIYNYGLWSLPTGWEEVVQGHLCPKCRKLFKKKMKPMEDLCRDGLNARKQIAADFMEKKA